MVSQVGNLKWLPGLPPNRSHSRTGPEHRSPAPLLDIGRRQVAMKRSVAESVSLEQPHHAIICLANSRRVLQHRVEYQAQVRRASWR